jgi:putative NIF3 family GTP cyclohydrolase 1 type 2
MNLKMFSGIGEKKKKFIEDSGIVVLRCHDVWDKMPDVGIPWAWGRFLGFTSKPAAISEDRYLHRYDIAPVTLDAFAKSVAAKTAAIGEPVVQVCGNPEQTVSRVGIGTGCGCNPAEFFELGCDAAVVCDDGTGYWSEIQPAKDAGFPVIRVNHGTSEEPGMATLAEYMRQNFPDIDCCHLPQGCCYKQVGVN